VIDEGPGGSRTLPPSNPWQPVSARRSGKTSRFFRHRPLPCTPVENRVSELSAPDGFPLKSHGAGRRRILPASVTACRSSATGDTPPCATFKAGWSLLLQAAKTDKTISRPTCPRSCELSDMEWEASTSRASITAKRWTETLDAIARSPWAQGMASVGLGSPSSSEILNRTPSCPQAIGGIGEGFSARSPSCKRLEESLMRLSRRAIRACFSPCSRMGWHLLQSPPQNRFRQELPLPLRQQPRQVERQRWSIASSDDPRGPQCFC